jgi:hypothetical protein
MPQPSRDVTARATRLSRARTPVRAGASTVCGSVRAALLVLVAVAGTAVAAPAQTAAVDLDGHWAAARVLELVRRGVVGLDANRRFHPDRPVTRAQYVAWMVAARGLPLLRPGASSFADVPPGHEAAAALESAAAVGIVPPGGLFRPDEHLTRAEAIVFLVRALGHTFEAAYMVHAPLPYVDLDGLPPAVRGAIAVAALSEPPLLREPPADRLRPDEPATRAEAASLLWAYLQAVERGMRLRFVTTLGQGVTLILEKRGALRVAPFWRVQVGSVLDEERARRLAAAMRARGYPADVEAVDEAFRVRVGWFRTREEAEALRLRLEPEGVAGRVILTVQDYDALAGPFWTGMLVVEPASGVTLRPALALDGFLGRGLVSEAARRAGALAAVNGGFFHAATGDPLGCLVIDGEVVSEPIPGRTCVGITDDGQLLFDTASFDAVVEVRGMRLPVAGINRPRGADEVIVYRPVFGPSTRTNPFGTEAVVVGDVVEQVVDGRGNTAIPREGFVLSGHGRMRAALATLRPGDRVTLRMRLVPGSGDPRWEGVRHILGGGPRLLADGQYVGGEGFPSSFTDRRHPRTALGRLEDGRALLVVVGGRQPYHSLGMTLPELAAMLRLLGVTDALNLDGGGSSTLVVRGVVVNLPSDGTGERPVGDVLLVMPPATQEQP